MKSPRVFAILFVLFAATLAQADYPYDAVCRLRVKTPTMFDPLEETGGSGVYIGNIENSAIILTCAHVAENPGNKVQIQFGSKRIYQGTVAAVHPSHDVAIVLCSIPQGIKPAVFSKDIPSPDTEPFVLCGYPVTDRAQRNYQIGTFSELTGTDLVVTCEPIPGMSGGACFNSKGEVCGVVAKYSEKWSIGYCTAGPVFRDWVTDYRRGRAIVHK